MFQRKTIHESRLDKAIPCLRENKHLSISSCDFLSGKTNLPCACSLLTLPVPKS